MNDQVHHITSDLLKSDLFNIFAKFSLACFSLLQTDWPPPCSSICPANCSTSYNFTHFSSLFVWNVNFWKPAIHVRAGIPSGIWRWTRLATSPTSLLSVTHLYPINHRIARLRYIYNGPEVDIAMFRRENLPVLGRTSVKFCKRMKAFE